MAIWGSSHDDLARCVFNAVAQSALFSHPPPFNLREVAGRAAVRRAHPLGMVGQTNTACHIVAARRVRLFVGEAGLRVPWSVKPTPHAAMTAAREQGSCGRGSNLEFEWWGRTKTGPSVDHSSFGPFDALVGCLWSSRRASFSPSLPRRRRASTLSAALRGHSSRSLGSLVWRMENIGVYLQGIMRGESKGPRYNFL